MSAAEAQRIDRCFPPLARTVDGEHVAAGIAGVADQLGEHALAGEVERVGAVLRAPGAVAGLVTAALRGHHHRLPAVGAAAGPARRHQAAVIEAVVPHRRSPRYRSPSPRSSRASGSSVRKATTPASASLPYRVEAGPRWISTRSTASRSTRSRPAEANWPML